MHTATLWSHYGDNGIWQPTVAQFYLLDKMLNSRNIERTIPINKLSWATFFALCWKTKHVHMLVTKMKFTVSMTSTCSHRRQINRKKEALDINSIKFKQNDNHFSVKKIVDNTVPFPYQFQCRIFRNRSH